MLLSGSRGFLSSESNFDGQVARRRRNSKEPHAHRQFAAVKKVYSTPKVMVVRRGSNKINNTGAHNRLHSAIAAAVSESTREMQLKTVSEPQARSIVAEEQPELN